MSKTRRSFTHFLALVVSGLGLLSGILLLSDPPPQAIPEIFAEGPGNINKKVEAHRGIASIDPIEMATPIVENALLEINCAQTHQSLTAWTPRFRLKGALCVPRDSTVLSTQISNKTNGYIATVFHQASQFSTDYINLKEGANDIHLKFETDQGVLEKDVVITRKIASAPRY